jgi:DNA-binding PadR family transcriptional regulator
MPTSTNPLNPRDFLILLALASGERHGYGLIKDIEELSVQAR